MTDDRCPRAGYYRCSNITCMEMPTDTADPCDICGATMMRPVLAVSLIDVTRAHVHRCPACGFRQVRPRLTAAEIRNLYPSEYFDDASPVGYVDYAREFQRRQREAYFLVQWLKRVRPEGQLLEVGCALGFLLAGLKRSGWRLEGVDASAFAAFYASTRYGLNVTCATLEEASFQDERFDVVIQKDLLEHVTDPRGHLNETYRLLRPGGWLRLVTPNGETNLRPLIVAAARTGAMLPVLDQGHLSFFSRGHLLRLFEECGFRCHRMRVIGIRRGLRALGLLPGQGRFVRQTVAAVPSPQGAEVSGAMDTAGFERLADRIDRDIAERHSRLRSWPPYFQLHRVTKQFDSLPAWCEVGYDFECLLQRL